MAGLLVMVPLAVVLFANLPFRSLIRARAAFWLGLVFCLVQAGLVLGAPRTFWTGCPDWLARVVNLSPQGDFNQMLVMFLAVAVVGFAALLVARHSMADAGRLANFASLVGLAVAGMNGVVLANDLFVLYIFLEVTAVASFVLIAFDRGRDAFEGAFKYVVLSAVATAMILGAISLLMMTTGGLSLDKPVSLLVSRTNQPLIVVAAALLLGGLFIKSGLVPFHGWVPDAYTTAPAATSVLLAGIVTKTTGVYALIRVVTSLFPGGSGDAALVYAILLLVGAASVVVGALAALGQTDFKRMLAYSSISQVGYIILGLGTGAAASNPDPNVARFAAIGLAGAVLHLFNHAVFKSLLFVNASAVERQTGTRDLGRLGGIAERMPITGISSAVAFLSTAGIPPLSGFWSKLLIIVALWGAGFHVYAAVAILASVITLAYFLVLQRRVFFGKLAEGLENLQETDGWNATACCLLAGIIVILGILTPWLFNTFLLPVGSIL